MRHTEIDTIEIIIYTIYTLPELYYSMNCNIPAALRAILYGNFLE